MTSSSDLGLDFILPYEFSRMNAEYYVTIKKIFDYVFYFTICNLSCSVNHKIKQKIYEVNFLSELSNHKTDTDIIAYG